MSISSEPFSVDRHRPEDSSISSFAGFTPHKLKSSQSMTSLYYSQSVEDLPTLQDHNVQVIIRARPLSNSEISSQGIEKCVRHESNNVITWSGQPETRFTFDFVADETVSQESLFNLAGISMVENCMGGYNSCMFAYGQTGSGKTHTMLGDIENGTRRHNVNCGITPRIFEYLFSRIQKEKELRKDDHLSFTCKCSFLEIYNEQILDLLDPSSMNLQIREDLKKGVYVENLKEVEIKNAKEVVLQLIQGAANRKVAATNMNHASSRSHSVFTCIIESKWESQGVSHHRFARLNLVDLAGSERQKSSGAEGERLKEATNINKSLSTLGLVIMNLVSISNGKSLHVPYRDSKLTFLLQDSLGGNSKTTIIANISPSLCCSLETLSTLKFAQRAKFIKNNAIINEDASGDVIAMRSQIQQLKKEVDRLRGIAYAENRNKVDDWEIIDASISVDGFLGEGAHNEFSPFASEKKRLQKSDYEIALVGSYKTMKDKDASIQALTANNQAVVHLAKQRADEIQSLKLRLRFRDAAIKRMEGVVIGKFSGEKHILSERDEHIKEIELLRNQVDRNQEVTKFAMENLQLKEEIRKFKSLNDEGEIKLMKEHVAALQNKLLEALDWKLMHEANSSFSLGNENDALKIQLEKDVLEKQLEVCFTEKTQLERHANDLIREIGIERARNDELHRNLTISAREIEAQKSEKEQLQRRVDDMMQELKEVNPTSSTAPDINELETIVNAISTASLKEAEAHKQLILLHRENEALQANLASSTADKNSLLSKLKAAIDEKDCLLQTHAKLTQSHERALAERDELQQLFDGGKQLQNVLAQFYETFKEQSQLETTIRTKKREVNLLMPLRAEADDRAAVSYKKLVAYKVVAASVVGIEQEECRVRANLRSKENEMEANLWAMERLIRKKTEAETIILMNEQWKKDLEKHHLCVRSTCEAVEQRKRRMLCEIDSNVKASELLNWEEENAKLVSQAGVARQRVVSVNRALLEMRGHHSRTCREMECAEIDFQKMSEIVRHGKLAARQLQQRRETASFLKGGLCELLVTYQENVFLADLKKLETSLVEEELSRLIQRVDEVVSVRSLLSQTIRCNQLLR